jgi:hypothetical protein
VFCLALANQKVDYGFVAGASRSAAAAHCEAIVPPHDRDARELNRASSIPRRPTSCSPDDPAFRGDQPVARQTTPHSAETNQLLVRQAAVARRPTSCASDKSLSPGSQRLRALVVFDEVYGFLPPHPANPATKRPLVALMKQARAFGVGVVVATQNPMDLDYRALSNAGLWCIGRLQTDADRARVIDGLSHAQDHGGPDGPDLGRTVQRLSNRWFVVHNAHATRSGPILLQPRQTYSWLRGPMTRTELRRALELRQALPSPSMGAPAAPPLAPAAREPAQLVPATATAISSES